MTIRNPIEWTTDQLKLAASALGSVAQAGGPIEAARPEIRHIDVGDLREVLRRGIEDFAACRTDVVFLCLIYPVVGLVLARLAFGYGLLPLLFPLASGFALIGPVAAIGLYEMSRRREQGLSVGFPDAFAVVRSHSFGAITALGLLLVALFLAWLIVAAILYDVTLGPEPPASVAGFVNDVFTTRPGWVMIAAGVGIGFCLCVAGAGDRHGVVSAIARSRCRVRRRGIDLGARRRRQPGPDRGLGADRRWRSRHQLDPVPPRACCRDAGAGPRHLASLPQIGCVWLNLLRGIGRRQFKTGQRADRDRLVGRARAEGPDLGDRHAADRGDDRR